MTGKCDIGDTHTFMNLLALSADRSSWSKIDIESLAEAAR